MRAEADEIATALHILVPIRSWLHDPGWRQFVRLLVIPYGLLPLVFIALFASSSNLSTPGWAYSLYIAPLWAIVFWLLIRPGQVTRREVAIGAGAIVFSLIWIRLVTVHVNGLLGPPGKPLSFFGAIGVGINEEVTKALPILLAALLLLKFRAGQARRPDVDVPRHDRGPGVRRHRAGRLTPSRTSRRSPRPRPTTRPSSRCWRSPSACSWTASSTPSGPGSRRSSSASRSTTRGAGSSSSRFGIAIPAVLHGLYDWSAGAFGSLWAPILLQAVSLFLFLGYTMSAAAIERQVRQTPMFRGESMLMERIFEPAGSSGHRRQAQPQQPQQPPGSAWPQPGATGTTAATGATGAVRGGVTVRGGAAAVLARPGVRNTA